MACYLDSGEKVQCFGCEACVQNCPNSAIRMVADKDGFRYPVVNESACVHCNLCRAVCPSIVLPDAHEPIITYGGSIKDESIRGDSTSGGAFSAIAEAWSDEDTIIFGAEAVGLEVRHCSISGTRELARLRKSKYLQSEIGMAFVQTRTALEEGRRVIFSGTPCQISALRNFLGDSNSERLLTIEVVCEGVPSPNYIRKFATWLGESRRGIVESVDYRYKDGRKWDFQVMRASLRSPNRGAFYWKQDRWFNPFWSIWLQHLISRPSCYECPFAKRGRAADISLGDLWGVHIYCPDLYACNSGVSVIFCNTTKGVSALKKALPLMVGRELNTEDAIRYQGPLRGHIKDNPAKTRCLEDIRSLAYEDIVRKWSKPPTLRLLWQKYVWGNRQKVWLWGLMNRRR